MSKQKLTSLKELGEFGLIERLTKNIKLRNKSSLTGVGDDAAVMNYGGKHTVVTTDMLVEGVHFSLVYTPLKHLGYKSVIVNLSDVYAMNAQPQQITVSIAVSSRFSVEALEAFYEGVYKACEMYGVDMVGGDTTSSVKGLVVTVTAIGVASADELVYRSGAAEGDVVCVSGDLGAAYMGLQLLEREKTVFIDNPDMQPDFEGMDYILERQLKPEARRDVLKELRNAEVKPTAMLDVSDGLSSEILHICKASGVGVLLQEDNLPVDAQTITMAERFGLDPTICAMNGGEDYELLFTLSPADWEKVADSEYFKAIGRIVAASEGVFLQTRNGSKVAIEAQGWNALSR